MHTGCINTHMPTHPSQNLPGPGGLVNRRGEGRSQKITDHPQPPPPQQMSGSPPSEGGLLKSSLGSLQPQAIVIFIDKFIHSTQYKMMYHLPGLSFLHLTFLKKILFIYLRDRERERMSSGEGQREREKQTPS